MSRTREERDRDRADLLAALDDYGSAMATNRLIAAAYGTHHLRIQPGSPRYTRGLADLRALERAGEVTRRLGFNSYVWERSTPPDPIEEADRRDVERMMASWETADG